MAAWDLQVGLHTYLLVAQETHFATRSQINQPTKAKLQGMHLSVSGGVIAAGDATILYALSN